MQEQGIETPASLRVLAKAINGEHRAILRCQRRSEEANRESVERAIRAAHDLNEAKRRIKFGEFEPWVEANCDVGVRRAQEYRYLAREPEKARASAHLGIDGALAVIRAGRRAEPPEEIRRAAGSDRNRACVPSVSVRVVTEYQLPLMSEVDLASDAPAIVSTFTGAGGSCLGFRLAEFRTLVASEFIEAARATYAANFPGVPVVAADVRDVSADDLLRAARTGVGEVDVLEGSAPCAAFSGCGRRQAAWGEVRRYSETHQRVDDLLGEFVRLLRGVQPRAFVMENVPGLARGVAVGVYNEVSAGLRDAGYDVRVSELDVQWCGVPQSSRRSSSRACASASRSTSAGGT